MPDEAPAPLEAAARLVLARPPVVPRAIELFSSNTLFGQPGIYPDGSPMVPATAGSVSSIGGALVDDEEHIAAALAALRGTVGEAVAEAFPTRTTARSLRFGVPASPGRVIGPAAGGDPADRVINERYRHEHPHLLAPSLAHDLLWSPDATGHAAETVLHVIEAMVHLRLLARTPELAHLGTELARKQSSVAITLFNSRPAGSPRITLLAPDGLGTIPGGSPAMATPDFWSVPFGPPGDDEAPPLLAAVLDGLVDPSTERPDPLRFDDELGRWWSTHVDDRWLLVRDQIAAGVALGLVRVEDLADIAGRPVAEVVEAWSLHAAVAVWGTGVARQVVAGAAGCGSPPAVGGNTPIV